MSPARYQEIAAALRSEIESEAFKVGDRLPPEPDLIARFEASRTTVRQALAELRDAGLVNMRQGLGVFVSPPKVVQRLDSRERLSRARRQRNEGAFLGDASQQGFTPSSSVRIWSERAGEFAELFGIDETDEVCVRDRVMRADGKPVMLATSRLPRAITKGTQLEEVDTGAGGAHARLEDLGLAPTFHKEIVTARTPDAHQRSTLGVSGPVLLVQRRTYSGDRLVEINNMVMDATAYELSYSWDAD